LQNRGKGGRDNLAAVPQGTGRAVLQREQEGRCRREREGRCRKEREEGEGTGKESAAENGDTMKLYWETEQSMSPAVPQGSYH